MAQRGAEGLEGCISPVALILHLESIPLETDFDLHGANRVTDGSHVREGQRRLVGVQVEWKCRGVDRAIHLGNGARRTRHTCRMQDAETDAIPVKSAGSLPIHPKGDLPLSITSDSPFQVKVISFSLFSTL